MAVLFSIQYSNIDSSIKQAKKTASELGDYVKEMNRVISSCDKVTGKDSKGYVGSATQRAREKVQRASRLKSSFSTFASDLSALEDLARAKDKSVKENIDVTVSNYVGKRKWYQQAGDWIYGMYIDFMNGVASIPVVGKYIAWAMRTEITAFSNTMRNIKNYFTYGDGKYIWNIITSVAEIAGVFMGVVLSASAVISAAPALAAIATVGCIFGLVYAGLKFGDMMATVDQNAKAFVLAKKYSSSTKDKATDQEETAQTGRRNWWDTENDEGSYTAARYYGNISGVKDWIDKTDFGGATINNVLGGVGFGYDGVKFVAKTVSTVCQIWTSLGNAQYLKGVDGEWVKNASGEVIKKNGNFFQNIRTTYLEKVGYEFKRTPVWNKYSKAKGHTVITGHDYGKAFKFKFFQGYDTKLASSGIKLGTGSKVFYNGSKLFSKITKTYSDVETILDAVTGQGDYTPVETEYEVGRAGIDLVSNFEWADTFFGDADKSLGLIGDMHKYGEKGFEAVFSPKENAFEAYLGKQSFSAGGGQGGGGGGGGRF